MAELARFLDAQDRIWPAPLDELRAGRKRTHWMWFVFPQLEGLGRSANAVFFAIQDLPEARAYLAHPILSARLHDAAAALLRHRGTPPERILGTVDALKLRSSATLFRQAGGDAVFQHVLDAFFDGEACRLTLDLLR